jgi:protein required for attachment to host cells
MKRKITWILVADHQHARLFSHDGPGRGVVPIEHLELEAHLPASRDLGTDRPGRGVSSRDGIRYGIEPGTDLHREAGRRFIARIVQLLGKASERREYDRLVLVAPPRAIGELRGLLPETVLARVSGTLTEDLTKASLATIEAHLAPVLAV